MMRRLCSASFLLIFCGCSSVLPPRQFSSLPPAIPAVTRAKSALVTRSPGSSVTLAWSPVGNIVGYYVYWGPGTRSYTNSVFSSTTNATVSGLNAGALYYFAATSTNQLGLESVYSGEISYQVPAPLTNWLVSVSVQQSTNLTTWNTITNIAAFTVTNQPGAQYYWRSLVNIQPQ